MYIGRRGTDPHRETIFGVSQESTGVSYLSFTPRGSAFLDRTTKQEGEGASDLIFLVFLIFSKSFSITFSSFIPFYMQDKKFT